MIILTRVQDPEHVYGGLHVSSMLPKHHTLPRVSVVHQYASGGNHSEVDKLNASNKEAATAQMGGKASSQCLKVSLCKNITHVMECCG